MKGVMKIEYEQDSERRCKNETTAKKKKADEERRAIEIKSMKTAYFKGILFTYCILSCFLFSCLLFVFVVVVHAFTFTKMAALLISCFFACTILIYSCNKHLQFTFRNKWMYNILLFLSGIKTHTQLSRG